MAKMADFCTNMRIGRLEHGTTSPQDLYIYLTGETTGIEHTLSTDELTADMAVIIIVSLRP